MPKRGYQLIVTSKLSETDQAQQRLLALCNLTPLHPLCYHEAFIVLINVSCNYFLVKSDGTLFCILNIIQIGKFIE